MKQLNIYHEKVIDILNDIFSGYKAEVFSLYEPVFYSLEGGKKIRPASVLLSADVFGGNIEQALIPAFAVEMFHNFTLLHDDVMDNSPLRRNRATVHAKWNINQAILSGDAMLILVYQKLMELPEKKLYPILKMINKTALEVCEGQQLDMEFENLNDVSIYDYIKMIKLKTAVLLGAALAMGAIISEAKQDDIDNIYNFGVSLGLSFQIQDDYFDTFGSYETFGKKIGNDIVTNKKTFLLISAQNMATAEQLDEIEKLYNDKNIEEELKIASVKKIFEDLKIPELAQKAINEYFQNALESLNKITGIKEDKKHLLFDFANYILKREK